jgi:creatinine amidohydrolase
MPILAEIDWENAEKAFDKSGIAAIPVGAIHDHGQSPLGVDFMIPVRICEKLASKTDAIVLPPICYGYNPSYMGWHKGSITVRPQCVYDLGLDICRSLYEWGIRKVLFVNGHGGSTPTLENIARTMYFGDQKMLIAIVEWWNLAKEIYRPCQEVISTRLKEDKHTSANFIEASAALSIDPSCVDLDKVKTVSYKKIFGSKIIPVKTTNVKFENGTIRMILGNKDIEQEDYNLCAAGKELGDEMLATVTDYLARFIEEFEKLEIPEE